MCKKRMPKQYLPKISSDTVQHKTDRLCDRKGCDYEKLQNVHEMWHHTILGPRWDCCKILGKLKIGFRDQG